MIAHKHLLLMEESMKDGGIMGKDQNLIRFQSENKAWMSVLLSSDWCLFLNPILVPLYSLLFEIVRSFLGEVINTKVKTVCKCKMFTLQAITSL